MKLLVSDYDDTFNTYISDHNVKLNVRKLNEFIDNGNMFMLSSGRSFNSLMDKVQKYKIPISYLATQDGSQLFDRNGTLLFERELDTEIVDKFDHLASLGKHKEIQYGTTREYYYEEPKLPIANINFIIDEKEITTEFNREWNRLKKENKEKYNLIRYGYQGTYYYCIKPIGIDKAKPVEELAKIVGLSKTNIFTVGDGDNDVPMIENYNGYVIGKKENANRVALKQYDEVYELIDEIEKNKVLRRW